MWRLIRSVYEDGRIFGYVWKEVVMIEARMEDGNDTEMWCKLLKSSIRV